MTATKDDVTKYTKPELIKALRAALAREARLAKKIEKLEARATVDAIKSELPQPACARDEYLRGIIDSPRAYTQPTFPWEKK